MSYLYKQSIQQSAIHFAGVLIGALSIFFIYPRDLEVYGLCRFMIDSAVFLAPLVFFGADTIAVRFFPIFKDSGNAHHGFFRILIRYALGGSIFFTLFYFLFLNQFLETYFSSREPLIRGNSLFLLPYVLLFAGINLLYFYISNFKKIAIPYLFFNFSRKIAVPIIIVIYLINWIQIKGVLIGLLFMYLISFFGLLAYLGNLGELKIPRINIQLYRPQKKEIRKYAFFGMAIGVSTILATSIDTIMVTFLIDLNSTGAYSIALFIAAAIYAPTQAISSIAGPVIAEAWKQNDAATIGKLYKESSELLLLSGLALYGGVLLALPQLISLLPADQSLHKLFGVFLFLGLGQVINMTGSVNNQIINYSNFYQFNLIATTILGLLNILLNLLFVLQFQLGITGVALATAISMMVYNLLKFVFIYRKVQIQPFTIRSLYMILTGVICYAGVTFFPWHHIPDWISMALKAGLYMIVFLLCVRYFKLSHLFNIKVDKLIRNVLKKK